MKETLNGMQVDIAFAIENKDKIRLYNLYHDKKITINELVKAIIEIDESVTDWCKFKKRCRTRWSRCKVWWLFIKRCVGSWRVT